MARNIVVKIYGDSLSLPRTQDGIDYGDEFALLIQKEISDVSGVPPIVYNRSRGGTTVRDLASSYREDRHYMPGGGIVVIQCGVVDCAPRPLPSFLRKLLGYAPGFFRRPAVNFLHENRARILKAGLGTRLTSQREFGRAMKKWLSDAVLSEELILVVNIAPTIEPVETHSPGFQRSIDDYNFEIKKAVDETASPKVLLIDVNCAIRESGEVTDFVNRDDGHHITAKGHSLYAGLLMEKISAFLGKEPVK